VKLKCQLDPFNCIYVTMKNTNKRKQELQKCMKFKSLMRTNKSNTKISDDDRKRVLSKSKQEVKEGRNE